jgi:hypothetical protein
LSCAAGREGAGGRPLVVGGERRREERRKRERRERRGEGGEMGDDVATT